MPRTAEATLRDAGLLAGRLLLVFIFLHESVGLIGNYAGAAGLYAEVRRAVLAAARRHRAPARRRPLGRCRSS